MIKPGICSVTFRGKTPQEIVSLCKETGLRGIEWAADAHVPPEDLANARHVGEMTRTAGLKVAGYGSYFLAFEKDGDPAQPFEPILNAAVELGSPIIRIWGGSMSRERSASYFSDVVERCRNAAEAASAKGVQISLEFHRNTFTETLEGAQQLLNAVNHPNLKMYWQPPHGSDLQQRLREIAAFGDQLIGVHVFHWAGSQKPPFPRLPLAEGRDIWLPCIEAIAQRENDLFALMEFVRDDSPDQFRQDALALIDWLKIANS